MKMLLPMIALAIAGCASHQPPACDDGGKNVMAYVDPRDGRLMFDGGGNVLDPETGRVAITRAQAECIEKRDQAIVNAAGGNRQ